MAKSLKTRSLGVIALGIYLLLVGLRGLIGLHFAGFGVLIALAALVAGILLLLGK